MVMTLILISSKLVEYFQKCIFMEEFLLCNFIEVTLLHGWSPVNLLQFCRTSFWRTRWWPRGAKVKFKNKSYKNKRKTKTKMKTKMDWFLFSVCFSFSFLFLFLLSKGFSIFVNSTWPRCAIDGQLSLDWPRSAIAFLLTPRGLDVP